MHLYNSLITSESLRILSSQFNSHFFSNIQVLDLGGNKLSFSGFRNLFESIIEGNIFLRELYLSSIYMIINNYVLNLYRMWIGKKQFRKTITMFHKQQYVVFKSY